MLLCFFYFYTFCTLNYQRNITGNWVHVDWLIAVTVIDYNHYWNLVTKILIGCTSSWNSNLTT